MAPAAADDVAVADRPPWGRGAPSRWWPPQGEGRARWKKKRHAPLHSRRRLYNGARTKKAVPTTLWAISWSGEGAVWRGHAPHPSVVSLDGAQKSRRARWWWGRVGRPWNEEGALRKPWGGGGGGVVCCVARATSQGHAADERRRKAVASVHNTPPVHEWRLLLDADGRRRRWATSPHSLGDWTTAAAAASACLLSPMRSHRETMRRCKRWGRRGYGGGQR